MSRGYLATLSSLGEIEARSRAHQNFTSPELWKVHM